MIFYMKTKWHFVVLVMTFFNEKCCGIDNHPGIRVPLLEVWWHPLIDLALGHPHGWFFELYIHQVDPCDESSAHCGWINPKTVSKVFNTQPQTQTDHGQKELIQMG